MIPVELKTINVKVSNGVFMSEQNTNVEQALKHVSTSKSFEYRSKSGMKAHSKNSKNSNAKYLKSKSSVEDKDANSGKAKIQYRNQMHIDDAIAYFEAIVEGLKKKKVEVTKEDKSIVLEPQEQLIVEVKASTKPERSKISFKMSWNHLDQGSFSIK